MRFPWKHRSTRFLQYKITNVKFYIVEITTLFLQYNKYQILHCRNYNTFFKRTNIKFYIVEPKTPLDNQLQCRLSHINKKLFLSWSHEPEGLKEILKHPKVTTTRHSSWKINRLKQPK